MLLCARLPEPCPWGRGGVGAVPSQRDPLSPLRNLWCFRSRRSTAPASHSAPTEPAWKVFVMQEEAEHQLGGWAQTPALEPVFETPREPLTSCWKAKSPPVPCTEAWMQAIEASQMSFASLWVRSRNISLLRSSDFPPHICCWTLCSQKGLCRKLGELPDGSLGACREPKVRFTAGCVLCPSSTKSLSRAT